MNLKIYQDFKKLFPDEARTLPGRVCWAFEQFESKPPQTPIYFMLTDDMKYDGFVRTDTEKIDVWGNNVPVRHSIHFNPKTFWFNRVLFHELRHVYQIESRVLTWGNAYNDVYWHGRHFKSLSHDESFIQYFFSPWEKDARKWTRKLLWRWTWTK